MFEPFFDQYLPSVTFNGGKPVYVPLHPPKDSIEKPTSDNWTIDFEELRYAARYVRCKYRLNANYIFQLIFWTEQTRCDSQNEDYYCQYSS